jgi:hypothetical protein
LNLFFELRKFQADHALAGMEHHVQGQKEPANVTLHGCPDSTPDAVSLYRASQDFADREADSWAAIIIPPPIKNRDIGGKVFLSLLVDRLKICVPEQS